MTTEKKAKIYDLLVEAEKHQQAINQIIQEIEKLKKNEETN